MIVKSGRQWFVSRSDQRTFSRVSRLPVLARTGTSLPSNVKKDKNKDGKPFFIVGRSKVGGEEVVG